MNSERETVAVREAVLSIDDQYVVACNIEGKIAAISPIADALFERHGASNSVDISDSLKGGQKVFSSLSLSLMDIHSHSTRMLDLEYVDWRTIRVADLRSVA